MKIGATVYDMPTKGKSRKLFEDLYGLGFRVFELYLPLYGVVSRDLSINKNTVKEVKDAVSTFTVEEFTAHGYYDDEVGVISNIASVDEATRRMAEKTLIPVIQICSELGVHVLCEHPGHCSPS